MSWVGLSMSRGGMSMSRGGGGYPMPHGIPTPSMVMRCSSSRQNVYGWPAGGRHPIGMLSC